MIVTIVGGITFFCAGCLVGYFQRLTIESERMAALAREILKQAENVQPRKLRLVK